MGGEEATKIIRKMEQSANRSPTPIIACTANLQDIDHYLSQGFDSILSKVGFRYAESPGSLLYWATYRR